MTEAALERMRRRVHEVRVRALIQRWNYRQRNLAGGVWFRIRRVLADAKEAYVIADEDARRLVAEGYTPEACGSEIAPTKTIVFVDPPRLAVVESGRSIPVSLNADFLAASAHSARAVRRRAGTIGRRRSPGLRLRIERNFVPHFLAQPTVLPSHFIAVA